jgi:hypothetical protein
MMPRPMPKKLAISRKFEKKPMYLTLAGTQRMSSSSTNKIAKLCEEQAGPGCAQRRSSDLVCWVRPARRRTGFRPKRSFRAAW